MTGRVLLRLRPVRIVRALSSEQRHDRYTGLLFLSAGGGALVILPAARVPALTHTGLGAMSRIRCGTGPISVRITTDLEPEFDRSRAGVRPISSRSSTDLAAECERFRRGVRPISANGEGGWDGSSQRSPAANLCLL